MSKIGLWGRSMGAAAALFYMSKNPGAASAVALDSGFSDLTNVIQSMAGTMGVPPEFVEMLFPMIE